MLGIKEMSKTSLKGKKIVKAKAASAKPIKKGGCGCMMEEIAMGLDRNSGVNTLLKELAGKKYDFNGAHVTIVVSIPTGSASTVEGRKEEDKDTQLSVHEVFNHHTDPDKRTGHVDLVFKTTDPSRVKEIFDDNFKEMITKE